MYALHTQYIVLTDALFFLWTMCSCPQVDKEAAQILRSYSADLQEHSTTPEVPFVDTSFVYIFGHDGVLSHPYVSVL